MTAPIWTDQQVTNQLLNGAFWDTDVLRYAFPATTSQVQTPGNEALGFVPLNDMQQDMASLGMALWADLIALPVVQSAPEQADIRFGMTTSDIEFAHAYYPPLGSVWFNASDRDLSDPAPRSYGFSTYVHEIGHALGLNHMGDYNGEGTWEPSSYQDSVVYSTMSYFGPEMGEGQGEVAWGNWWNAEGILVSQQTPMINDIMAIQQLYGASNARADDTVYGFGSTVGGDIGWFYDFSRDTDPVLAIYDSGGIDTLDLSGWGTDSRVDLAPGAFSSANGMTNNLSLARNTVIENVVTGAGDDTVVGNAADNRIEAEGGYDRLFGGEGNDSLDGGSGVDVARFTLNAEDATLHHADDGSLVVAAGVLGNVTLDSVELLRFDDRVMLTEMPASIDTSGFDEAFYLAQNPDVAAAVARGDFVSGYAHYLQYGMAEERDPDALFDSAWYLAQNPDVDAAVAQGVFDSAYEHYLAYGSDEGRLPSAWFDTAAYLAANPDVAASDIDPLAHYLAYGVGEGRVIVAADDGLWV